MTADRTSRLGALAGALLLSIAIGLAAFWLGGAAAPLEASQGNGGAQLRLAHLAPFDSVPADTSVDVRVNGSDFITDFQYLDSTTYLPVAAGSYTVEIALSGTATPVLTTSLTLTDGVAYTAIAHGGANSWDLAVAALEDDLTTPVTGTGHVRLGHLAPFASASVSTTADIRLDDGTPVLTNVVYTDFSGYISLPAGMYDLEVTTPGGGDVLIDVAPFMLNDGDILDAYAVGDGTNQDLGVFAFPSNAEGFLLPADEAQLRVAHLAPFDDMDTAVDVSLNGNTVLTDFSYADSTTYLTLPEDEYLVEVAPAGTVTPVLSATVTLTGSMDYTAIAWGGANTWPLDLALLEDDNSAPDAGEGKVRFGHLAPFASASVSTTADIRLDDGTAVITGVVFGDIAGMYVELPAGMYDLEVTTPGGGDVLIDVAPFMLNDGDILDAYAVGDGTNQDLGVFAYPSTAEGFLLPADEAQLRVAHLAPFDDMDTAVDIALNGSTVLTDVSYVDSTTYLTLPEDEYLVEVSLAGTVTPVLSATVTLTGSMDYTAIAWGGANMWPLDLALLEDDNSAPAPGNGKIRFGHLAPFTNTLPATLADIRLDDGTAVITDVAFGDIAGMYMELPAGEYDLQVTTPGGGAVLINVAPFTLNDGDILYALAVGDGSNQDLRVFAYPTDATGFLLPEEFTYYLPFIATP